MDGDGRRRVVIETIAPEVDGGRFSIKRTVGEEVAVEADVLADGHDAIACIVQYRAESASTWSEVAMRPLGNDRWQGAFYVEQLGRYRYTVSAWIDHFESWRRELVRRVEPEDIESALRVGGELIEQGAQRADGEDAARLRAWVRRFTTKIPLSERRDAALEEDLAQLMARYPDRRFASQYDKELEVAVERERARFSSWYEVFPRSCAAEAGRHGTLKDCAQRLPYIAAMGFDVLYLPPVHPIGRIKRKGRNNALVAGPDDVGSPWAIGAKEGGHKAVHPALGTLDDFHDLVSRAKEHGIELALDIAFQCAPDHPYVEAHPEWFRIRPDGKVQYAENPPKKYEDIYPFNFETEA